MTLYIAFIVLTKAFDLVSREGLSAIAMKIGCPPNLLNVIKSIHTNKSAIIQCDGNVFNSFKIKSGVKCAYLLKLFLNLLFNAGKTCFLFINLGISSVQELMVAFSTFTSESKAKSLPNYVVFSFLMIPHSLLVVFKTYNLYWVYFNWHPQISTLQLVLKN